MIDDLMQGISMRYLVTGGTGYVGVHVVAALLKKGHEVVIASRHTCDNLPSETSFVAIDVLNSDEHIFERTGKPDVLIHLAWEDGFSHASTNHLDNLHKHIQFLKHMFAGGLKHVVGIGTMHEIGYHVGPVCEFTPTFPQHAYGIAKNHLRLVQTLLCREFGAIDQWIRCFYILGDDHLNNSIFSKMLRAEGEGRESFPLNTGELLYDFIHVVELGDMIADVSGQCEVTGVINCCSGNPISLKTMVHNFISQNGLKLKPLWGEFPIRPYDSRAIWGDIQKLQLALSATSV